jgi:GTP-binding protein EngB required for normal cell division
VNLVAISSKKPLLVIIGRSNTGKSSLCRLLAPKAAAKLIKVGKNPGVTRGPKEIDNGEYTIVDLPGFGYMLHASKEFQGKVQDRIISFIENRHQDIFLAIEVINIEMFRIAFDKHKDSSVPFDKELFEFLQEFKVPTVVIANKIDKLRSQAAEAEVEYLKQAMAFSSARAFPPTNVIPFSTKEGTGSEALLEKIGRYLKEFTSTGGGKGSLRLVVPR